MLLPIRGFARIGAVSKQRNARTSGRGPLGLPASGLRTSSQPPSPTGRTWSFRR